MSRIYADFLFNMGFSCRERADHRFCFSNFVSKDYS